MTVISIRLESANPRDWTHDPVSESNALHAFVIDVTKKTTQSIYRPGGQTPLHAAASNGHLETVRILIRAGAKLDVPDSANCTPLKSTVRFKYMHIYT